MAWTGVLEYKSGYDNTAFICMLNAVKGMNKMKSIRILLILGCAVCLAGSQKTENENGKPYPGNKTSEESETETLEENETETLEESETETRNEDIVEKTSSQKTDISNAKIKASKASTNVVLDKIGDRKRGMGAIICMVDKKTYLQDNLVALPFEYV
jgi:hypothetical protein